MADRLCLLAARLIDDLLPAVITDPKVLVKILDHLGLPSSSPAIAPPRLPGDADADLLPLFPRDVTEHITPTAPQAPYYTQFPLAPS